MGKLNTNKEINTLNRKIELLEHAVGANAEVYYNINLNLKYIISTEGKSNLNDIFKRVRDGVSLIRLVFMKNIPELLTEQVEY